MIKILDRWLCISKGLYARFLCNVCKAHCFEAETVVIQGTRHHRGCGGSICKVLF